jgi:hypothetical protein
MVRKFVAATVSAALCFWSVAPAMAQDYRYSGFDAPRGATATANLRVPLGRQGKTKKATYGLSFGIGKPMGAGYDGRPVTRQLRLADIRFSTDGKLDRAQVASFNLADPRGDRMNLAGGGNTLWIVGGLVAAGVAVCLLADCFDDNDAQPAN